MKQQPGDDVVTAAQAGDRSAFGELYSGYARLVHAVLLARLPVSEAEDLVQEVFFTAWRQIGRLRDPSAFGAWISTIARNRAADFHRRAEKFEELDERQCGSTASQETVAEVRRAMQAIRSLPDAYRESMILRLVEGMTGPEIAARVGLSPGSVRVNLHRGMQILREALGKEAVS